MSSQKQLPEETILFFENIMEDFTNVFAVKSIRTTRYYASPGISEQISKENSRKNLFIPS
jgi:hypothetical protein